MILLCALLFYLFSLLFDSLLSLLLFSKGCVTPILISRKRLNAKKSKFVAYKPPVSQFSTKCPKNLKKILKFSKKFQTFSNKIQKISNFCKNFQELPEISKSLKILGNLEMFGYLLGRTRSFWNAWPSRFSVEKPIHNFDLSESLYNRVQWSF